MIDVSAGSMTLGRRELGFNVLWLQSGGCGGCSMSLLCADTTDFHGHLRDAQLTSEASADTRDVREAFRQEAQRWLPEQDSEEPFLDLADDDSVLTLGARVLVVDDNADMRDYLARLLRQR